MKIKPEKLKKVLLDQNYVTEEDFRSAEDYAKRYRKPVIDYLLDKKLITKELLGQAIAESFGIGYADLNNHPPPKEKVLAIPKEIAYEHRVVLYEYDESAVTLATDDPVQATRFFKELRDLFPEKEIKMVYTLTEFLEEAFIHYRADLNVRLQDLSKAGGQVAPEMLREVLDDARVFKVSDIHFEPEETEVIIRMRIDGVLREVGNLAKDIYENILNRVKVLAQLRVDDHFSAQDGAIRFKQKDIDIDLRISIAPTLNGEKIAMRVLAEYTRGLTFTELGFSTKNEELIRNAAQNPFGMILIAGPTGSGKTTTLYALLKILNNREMNITTIEDPVEYRIPGINQIQVNPQTNLTFAKGLRTIVRQDPDIILVGEIRDQETAEISINAALSGHLLFSTFHANDAATALPRLLDMGLEEFLLASTLDIVVSQRLVRRICTSCKKSEVYQKKDLIEKYKIPDGIFEEDSIRLYEGKGCPACNNTKYKGRIALFEIIQVTSGIQDLIIQNASSDELWEQAISDGAKSMFEDGLEKVKQGVTTLDELLRVAPPHERIRLNEKSGSRK